MEGIKYQYGRPRANINALDSNNWQIDDCDGCPDNPSCKDEGSGTGYTAETVTGITVDGTAYAFDSPIAYTESAAITEAIEDILKELGEIWRWVRYEGAGGAIVFSHIGALAVEEITTSGANITTSRVCDTLIQCRFKYNFADNVVGTVNGDALAGPAYDVGTPADAARLEGDIETLLTADAANYQDVVVVADTTNNVFVVHIFAQKDEVITINGESVTRCECKEVFA